MPGSSNDNEHTDEFTTRDYIEQIENASESETEIDVEEANNRDDNAGGQDKEPGK